SRRRRRTARHVRLVDADSEMERTGAFAIRVVAAWIAIRAAYLGCSTGRHRFDSVEHREAIVLRSVTTEDTHRGRRSRDAERHGDGERANDQRNCSRKTALP